jgi:oligopeptide transport system substrate-binding protein
MSDGASDRRISRRNLLRAGPVVAGLSGFGALSAVASGPGPARPVFLDDAGRPIAGEPVVLTAPIEPLGQDAQPSGEQVLRLAGQIQGPETLDPHLARDLPTTFLIRQVFRGLTRIGGDAQPALELAERIEISADGLEYLFTVRPEATFHNGRQMTAADVAFSFTHALDPATAGGEAALLGGPTFLSDIDGARELLNGEATSLRGVEVVDGRTLRVRLVEPRAAFLMKVAAAQASIIDPNNVAASAEWWRDPNGTGPFRVAEWVPDDHLTLERFDGFFAGPPMLERVEIALGPNAFQSFNLYSAGRIDVDSVPLSSVDSVMSPRSQLRREVTTTEAFGTFYVAFRADAPPMDDPLVRRAVFRAFPSERVAELTFNNTVRPAYGLIPPGMLGQEWHGTIEPYDLEGARADLAASTYGSAEAVPTLEIYTSFGGPAESLRDVLRRDLGLSCEVFSVDFPQFVDGLARRRYPAYSWYWGADYPDPENFLWTLFGQDSPENFVAYENPAMNDLLRQARAEVDVVRRAELYFQAQEVLLADHVLMPLYHDVGYTLAKSYVRDLEVTPLGIVRLETIWLER